MISSHTLAMKPIETLDNSLFSGQEEEINGKPIMKSCQAMICPESHNESTANDDYTNKWVNIYSLYISPKSIY